MHPLAAGSPGGWQVKKLLGLICWAFVPDVAAQQTDTVVCLWTCCLPLVTMLAQRSRVVCVVAGYLDAVCGVVLPARATKNLNNTCRSAYLAGRHQSMTLCILTMAGS
jgi:hypothetical protein